MRNINIDKAVDFSQIRAERQNDVRKSSKETAQIFENKSSDTADQLKISERGSEVGKLVGKLKELPAARQEKINSLREQIASGSYNPSSERIADAILKDEKF